MAELIGNSELVRRAVAYLEQRLTEQKAFQPAALLDEAAMRFNLSPLEAAKVESIFRDRLFKK